MKSIGIFSAQKKYLIYTDGSCLGNPGPGGWGSVIFLDEPPEQCGHSEQSEQDQSSTRIEMCGGEQQTTNNRMELLAVIESLSMFKQSTDIIIVSDSEYVVKGSNEWLAGWKKRDWKKSGSNKPVINADLWRRLDDLLQHHTVTLKWTRAHVGSIWNERADELANIAANRIVENNS